MSRDATRPAGGRPPMSNRKLLGIWVPVLAVVTALAVVVNVALVVAGGWVASQLGSGTYTFTNSDESADWDTEYYTSRFASLEDVDAAARDLVEQIAAGGIVLAKNDAATLPLATGARVTMLGRAAADPVFGGSGSGSVDTNSAVTARAGLENAGFEVNDAVYGAIEAYAAEQPRGFIEMDRPDISTYFIGELPVGEYAAQAATFDRYGDAALVFLGRPGGEGGDLTQDMTGWDDHAVPGQHQLQLNQDERDLIALATESFDTVVVVVNASTTMELGALHDDPDVAAILLAGSPGATGFDALGAVLAGEVNPSGRTADVWAADFAADPTYPNVGDFVYENLEVSYPVPAVERATSNATVTGDAPFVHYAEGIYIGYRYYETAAAEDFIDYEDAVVYPFGHGLAYTTFDQRVTDTDLGAVDGSITVDVEVTNTGDVAGREVVQLYASAPYTPGGIEKAEVVLVAFDKTSELAPGASETVTLEVAVEDLASYDHIGHEAYVLEAGTYLLSVRSDSHTLAAGTEPIRYVVDVDVVYAGEDHRASDHAPVTNQFDDVSEQFSATPTGGKVLSMSRADFAGTFPTAPTPDLYVASDAVAEGFAAWDHEAAAADYDGENPTTDARSEIALVDLRGLPKDDPQWEELLDSLSVGDMTDMLLNGAYQTSAIGSIAKPQTTEPDGPAGFSSFINSSINGVAYPSEALIAQTWDIELGAEMGRMLGEEALHKDINGWYAPAVNLHRSPFGGRNFEYYSEDPHLSGALLTAVANGAAEQGVYTMLKHYALNEQETNRVNNGIATWATEQTIRELYLKPFEMAVKNISMEVPFLADDEGTPARTTIGAGGVMSSFNRIGATWAGGSEALMGTVLRDEWGFEGFAISDFNLYPYMNPNEGIHAGTDLTLTFQPSKSFNDTTSAKARADIRAATHNILFTVANSNAMNGLAPGATVSYTPPAWVLGQVIGTAVLGLLVAAGVLLLVRRVRRTGRAGTP
ncbi:glycoside hydrolase family 3 C-terminal domain-containing protein [Cellulosimicrobium cellulans]|uniref:glycoside hydrolase family 3 C-terminal domain-containing protein n=1 Tax=Cellulosimicrobium cellulans TaxID=1710 RepID=UPI0021CB52D9|nr:glycoside hydrolase family 3 C-terminal domain-containing protein [Cellulosimicrobium cellulans]